MKYCDFWKESLNVYIEIEYIMFIPETIIILKYFNCFLKLYILCGEP